MVVPVRIKIWEDLERSGRSKRLEEIFVQLAGISLGRAQAQDILMEGICPKKFQLVPSVVIDQNTYCTQFRDKVQQGQAEYAECPDAQVKAGGATILGFRADGMVIPRSWNHFQIILL